ncbi:MAG: twitching motility protein, partial [Aquificaceae bacterium]
MFFAFSFGLHNIGRFRVSEDKEGISKLKEIVRLHNSGVVIIQCKNQAMASPFVYSFLQSLCENYSKVIYILESPLSFLLKHGQSLVIQKEVGVDVESFEEGLKDAFYIRA